MDTKLPPKPQNADQPLAADPRLTKALDAGHEVSDVNVRGLFIFAFALLVSVAAAFAVGGAMFAAFRFLNHKVDTRQPTKEPGVASLVKVAPDYEGPLLQVKPEQDLGAMRVENAAHLQTYAWIDRPAGVVRLPVDRAMDLLAERGLPPVSPGKTLESLQRERARPQVFGQSLRP